VIVWPVGTSVISGWCHGEFLGSNGNPPVFIIKGGRGLECGKAAIANLAYCQSIFRRFRASHTIEIVVIGNQELMTPRRGSLCHDRIGNDCAEAVISHDDRKSIANVCFVVCLVTVLAKESVKENVKYEVNSFLVFWFVVLLSWFMT